MSVDNVADIDPIDQYTASASQTEFDYSFPIFADADLVVYDNDTLMVLTTDYTVTGEGEDAGGTVTFTSGRTAGHIITIYRDVAIARTTDFQQNGARTSVAMNDELDRMTMWMQQLERNVGRAIRQTLRSSQASADLEIDSNFEGKYLYINDDGELEPAAAIDTTTLTQSIIAALLYPRTPAEIAASVTPVNYAIPSHEVCGYIDPDRYDATNDGSTNSDDGIDDAITLANYLCDIVSDSLDVARYPKLWFRPGLGYVVTTAKSIRAGVVVVMDAPLLISAAAGATGTWVDMVDAKNVDYQAPRGTACVFDIRRVTQSDWSSTNDIGLRIPAGYVMSPYLKRISGFCVNADVCLGYGDVRLGDIRDAKFHLTIRDRTGTDNFTNHLYVRGGTFSNAGGLGTNVARTGIRLIAAAGINTVTFDGQSFELSDVTAGSAETLCYLVDGSSAAISSIRFINQRAEGCGPAFARCTGQVKNCEFGIADHELEYDFPTSLLLDDLSDYGGNVLYRHHGASAPTWETFFDSQRFVKRAVQLTGSVITIINFESATSVGAAPATQTFAYGDAGPAFDTDGYMTASGPFFGVRVALNGSHTLGIVGRKPASNAASLAVILFDSSGTQIVANNKVTLEGSGVSCTTGAYGGYYNIGVNPSNSAPLFEAVLGFDSDVATVFISVTTKCDGFVLRRADRRPTWFSATQHMNGEFIGDAIPIALTNVAYFRGMTVRKINAGSGAPSKWVCSNAGVPTFLPDANL